MSWNKRNNYSSVHFHIHIFG